MKHKLQMQAPIFRAILLESSLLKQVLSRRQFNQRHGLKESKLSGKNDEEKNYVDKQL